MDVLPFGRRIKEILLIFEVVSFLYSGDSYFAF